MIKAYSVSIKNNTNDSRSIDYFSSNKKAMEFVNDNFEFHSIYFNYGIAYTRKADKSNLYDYNCYYLLSDDIDIRYIIDIDPVIVN